MKIDTLGIQAFLAIADRGGFSKAAHSLHITQTALTRRLQNLEANLGVKLIERTTRSVALTSIGNDFLPRAQRLLAELQASLTEIHESGKAQRGEISIACIQSAGEHYLPRIIGEYSRRYPDNRIKILDYLSSGVTEAVLRREAELGIKVAGSHDPELESVPLLQDRFVLICRDDHPLADRKGLSWKQLEPYPLIFPHASNNNRTQLDLALGAAKIALRLTFEVHRFSIALGMAAEGVAAAVVPRVAVRRDAYPNLRVLPLTAPVVSRTLVLLSRRSAYLSPAAQALYEMIRTSSNTGRR